MGENLAAEGRNAVRTPMQWTSEPGGGFSAAPPEKFPAPVVEGGYGPEHVNVQDQRADPDSLLNFMRLLISRYRSCPELGWGDWSLLEQDDPALFAHRAEWDGSAIIAIHNLSGRATEATLALVLFGWAIVIYLHTWWSTLPGA